MSRHLHGKIAQHQRHMRKADRCHCFVNSALCVQHALACHAAKQMLIGPVSLPVKYGWWPRCQNG